MDLLKATKRLSAVVLLLAATAAPVTAAPAASGKPGSAPGGCEALRQWVLDHRADLPTDYFSLRTYPANEHRAIYSLLEAEQKAAYWHDKLATYLAEHPELHSKQVAAIGEATALIRPDIYRITDPENETRQAVDRELAAAAQKLIEAVGERVAAEAFFGLGLDEDNGRGSVVGKGVLEDGNPPSEICKCRTYYDCGGPFICGLVQGENCVWAIGCGLFGTSYCTGLCIYPV